MGAMDMEGVDLWLEEGRGSRNVKPNRYIVVGIF